MSAQRELSTGEAIIRLLEAYGVDTVFGIPGVHNVELYRSLPHSKIKHVLVRHEQGAGFMADGYARATGRPGVCFAITGPGLTNILTPMGQAWSDSSPILIIASSLHMSNPPQGRGRLHEMRSQINAAQSVTSYAREAFTPGDVREALSEAFSNFATLRPRPYYLEIPVDLLSTPAGRGWSIRPIPNAPAVNAKSIESAVSLLVSSLQPLLILGGGARGAPAAALKLAERLGAVVLTTIAGKGIVPESHPLSAGYILARDRTKEIISKADVVVAVGTEFSEVDFEGYKFDSDIPGLAEKLIRIDIDPANLTRPYVPHLAILSDANEALQSIVAALPENYVPSRSGADSARFLREAGEASELRAVLRKVLDTIRKSLPPDAIVSSDMTQIAYAANEEFRVESPRAWLHPVGFGTLGFALPAGIGAKFGARQKAVAVLTGDYGIQYTANELGTAVEHKLPIIILLWNNNALGEIRDDMLSKNIQPNAINLKNPDFLMLGKAYGCRASRPGSLKDLAAAIYEALRADGPTLIEITPEMVK